MASEQAFNINFVQEVENYPCLYNYTLPDYARKDVTEMAWSEIARKFNLTGAQCKEKWRNLRNVFVRNMKPGKSGAGAKKKPYYLNEVMQFTLPFIKLSTASVSGNLEMPPDNEINQHDIDESDEEDESQSVLNNFFNRTDTFNTQIGSEHREIPTPSPQSPYSVPSSSPQSRPLPTPSPHSSSVSMPMLSPQSRPLPTLSPTSDLSTKKKTRKTKNTVDETIMNYFKAKQARAGIKENQAENPKKMFLLSLLPDLEPISDIQMRQFKKGVLQLIDAILEDSPTNPSPVDKNSEITLYYASEGKNLNTPFNENN